MWGDASLVGHGAARMNPLRWSYRKTFDAAIEDLQQVPSEKRARAVAIRVYETDPSTGDAEIIMSQHFANVEEAVARMRELASAPSHATAPELAAISFRSDASASAQLSSEPTFPSQKPAPSADAALEAGASADSSLEATAPRQQNLAGMLEKKSRWRMEWEFRFFVMRQDRIDYYLTPPALMEDEGAAERRGSIPLSQATAVQDEGRPYCITVGSEIIACQSLAEQQRWVEAMNTAAVALAKANASAENPEAALVSNLAASKLLLLPLGASEDVRSVKWREQVSTTVAGSDGMVTVLFLEVGHTKHADGSSFTSSRSENSRGLAQAVCRLSLADMPAGATSSAPVRLLGDVGHDAGIGSGITLGVRVHSNELQAAKVFSSLLPVTTCICVLAIALLLAGSTRIAAGAIAVVGVMQLLEVRRTRAAPPRNVAFSIEQVQRTSVPAFLSTTPAWVGKWKLDKTCSEPYAPILEDLGVGYVLRKAVDAANTSLIVSISPTHVTIQLKIWVTVEDCVPLDGSWASKPVPPGSKMQGECQVRVAKVTDTELEMYTEFPDGNGDLRDITTMHEDGNAFTRVVVRGDIRVARVFRRMAIA